MTTHRWRRIAVATTAAGLLLPIATAWAAPTPGASGIGDPYYPEYGNGGYDVGHYDIAVQYDRATDTLSGTTTLTATATQDLSTFDLDFVLTASSVAVNGTAAQWSGAGHELVVTPQSWVQAGDPLTVTVAYSGHPSSIVIPAYGYSPWIQTSDGVAAVGEPEIAAWWYPANDHPRDKATYDISVTTAADEEALSNGVLVSDDITGSNRTWHWRENSPMASYLAFFVTGQYDITHSTSHGLPVITAVASNGGSEGTYAAADLARTPEIIDWQASHWGPYPFDALGGVAPAADFGFALENQTRPVYTRGFWGNGPNIYVVVHELGHMWFGDSVSVYNWRDIWLNEGFASFTEWLWSEEHGDGTGADLFLDYWKYYRNKTDFWSRVIGDPGAGHEFAGAVYDRGAMTLQALRTRIGDDDFFTTMRRWATERRYGNGEIPQFVALAEQVSGQDLTSFFQAWLYSPTRPAISADNGFPDKFPGPKDKQPKAKSFDTIRQTHNRLADARD